MKTVEELIGEIVRQTGLPQERVMQLVQEKKQKVGSGFLSDAGATYLVAADLGVEIKTSPISSQLTINQISVGLNEVTTVGRILSVMPPNVYKKKNGETGVYRRLIVYDSTSHIFVTLWDNVVPLVDGLGLKRGDIVRVVKAYVRPGLDMRPVLHVGERGTLEVLNDEELEKRIPSIDGIARDLSETGKETFLLLIKGKVVAPPYETSFVKKDGSLSTMVSFTATGVNGGTLRRIVIWGRDAKSSPINQLNQNTHFLLTNVRVKMPLHGEPELHAGESSELIVSSPEIFVKARRLFRVLSVHTGQDTDVFQLLVADESRKIIQVKIRKGKKMLSQLDIGDVIAYQGEPSPHDQLIIDDTDTLERVLSHEPDIDKLPTLQSFFTKISSIKPVASPVFLQAMALSRGNVQQLDTKKGERVLKGELIIGDDTGELTVIAWRNQAHIFDSIVPGEKIWILGFVPRQTYTGVSLEAKPYSSIVQPRFRTINP